MNAQDFLPRRLGMELVFVGLLWALWGSLSGAQLTLVSPKNWQVFQRNPADWAQVRIAGNLGTAADRLEASAVPQAGYLGEAVGWTTLVEPAPAGAFVAHLALAAGGWYRVDVRAIRNGSPAEAVYLERVGVGEVFITCGQSNSTNSAEVRTNVQSGMVSAFDGQNWVIGHDPQPGAHDGSTGGSVYPKLGDKLFETLRVPIAFATTGHGGRPIEDWLVASHTGLYEWLRARVLALGENHPRCVLWHQGESNAWLGAPNPELYASRMITIVNQLNSDIGYTLPWVTCKATYIPGSYPNATATIVRSQQQWLWDNGITLQGPDTDPYQEGYRSSIDHIHFNLAGLEVFSDLYHQSIIADFGLEQPNVTPTPTRPPGCILVSEGRPVTADSIYLDVYGPEKVTDGEIGTERGRWISNLGAAHWCAIDLGATSEICEVQVYSDEAYVGEPVWNLSAYTVRGSVDGAGDVATWAVLAEFEDPCGAPYPDYPGTKPNARNVHFVSGLYRYIALHITGSDGECGPVCRVQEVQVFGTEPGAPTPTPTPGELRSLLSIW